MAKFSQYGKDSRKRDNRKLMRELHIIVSTREPVDLDALSDEDFWNNYEQVEPLQHTRFDLSD